MSLKIRNGDLRAIALAILQHPFAVRTEPERLSTASKQDEKFARSRPEGRHYERPQRGDGDLVFQIAAERLPQRHC